MPDLERSWKFLVRIFAGLAVAGIVSFLLFVWVYAFTPGPLLSEQEVRVFIPANTGFDAVQEILTDHGLIEDDIRFHVLARLMGVAHRLKAGEYVFKAPQVPYEVLTALEKGSVVYRSLTIPEGANVFQISDIFSKEGLVARDEFLALVRDKDFIEELGLGVDSLEGYLFPDTYRFTRGQDGRVLVRTLVQRLLQVYEQAASPACEKSQGKSPLTRHEVLTMASIVEKETGQAEERQLIAAVFLNRLHKGIRLQADPTVIYGLERFDGNLTRADLKAPTPYNTYVVKGLPPGPIANPGRASIEAVLNPAEVDYLYFVSRNNGTHQFSKTLAEHNRAVRRYQKR